MTKPVRTCDQCGGKLPPGVARTPKDGKLVCGGCRDGREGRPLTGTKEVQWIKAEAPFANIDGHMVRIAHQSNDNTVIYHCPFCGSGQVVARSDGVTACDFCDSTFIVQIQPQQHAMPQTINGVPFQIPGMPPPSTSEPKDNSITNPQDPNQQPNEATEPDHDSFGGDDLSEKVDTKEDDSIKDLNKGAMFITSTGMALPLADFEAHIALAHTANKEATLEEVRRNRET